MDGLDAGTRVNEREAGTEVDGLDAGIGVEWM